MEFLLLVDGWVSGIGSRTMDQIKAFGSEIEDLGDFNEDFNWKRKKDQT